jgi:hypothetical protein
VRTVLPSAPTAPLSDAEKKRLERATADALEAPAPRRKSPGAGTERPLGHIILRKTVRGSRTLLVRFIKVATTGTQSERWQPYARVVWERQHGPVPRGLKVIHRDGDSLNDDLSNLITGTTDDALFMAHARGVDSNSLEQRRATAESNRLRSRTKRLRGALRMRWYLEDSDRRVLWNVAAKSRWDALVAAGVDVGTRAANGQGWYSSAAGWPDVSDVGAALLLVLVDAWRGTPRAEVLRLAIAELTRVGIAPPTCRGTWLCEVAKLRRAGLVVRETTHGGPWTAADLARTSRKRSTALVPVNEVRTKELLAQGYGFVNERGQEYQRERADWGELLAAAVAGAVA